MCRQNYFIRGLRSRCNSKVPAWSQMITKQKQFLREYQLDFHKLFEEIVWRNVARILRDSELTQSFKHVLHGTDSSTGVFYSDIHGLCNPHLNDLPLFPFFLISLVFLSPLFHSRCGLLFGSEGNFAWSNFILYIGVLMENCKLPTYFSCDSKIFLL